MKKGVIRGLSGILLLTGALLILNSFSGITGFVVFEQIKKSVSTIIGLIFFIFGIAGFFVEKLEKIVKTGTRAKITLDKYISKRIQELTDNNESAYVSQWELMPIIKKLEEMGYVINRGKGHVAESHTTSKKQIQKYDRKNPDIFRSNNIPRHINLEGYNKNKVWIKKHLYITRDPSDPRLKEYHGRQYNSYDPKHPRGNISNGKRYSKKK